MQSLLTTLPQVGRVEWIGLRPARREPMIDSKRIEVNTEQGIVGDRYSGRSGKRHLTLIQAEHLPVIASYVRRESLHPEIFRRNLLVSGLNLLALKKQYVLVGDAEIEVTGECHPCSYMEEVLGPGGYNAVRGHGGVTARIIKAGTINIGDEIRLILKNDIPGEKITN